MRKLSDFPVLDGAWPILGHMGEMYRRFPSLCQRGIDAHGPLFWVLGGPGARQLMYAAPSALGLLKNPAVSTSFYTEGFEALLGNTIFAMDGDQHRRVRQAITPPFTPQRVRASDIVTVVTDAFERRLDAWARAGTFDIVDQAREMTLEIIFRVVGVPVRDLDEWRKQYNRFILAGIPSRGEARGPIHWYAMRARRWIDARLVAIVDELRARKETSTLVGAIANGKDETGAFLPRDLVVANLRILVFAGHETSASSIAWTAMHFAAAPKLQRRAMAEVTGPDGALLETEELTALATDGGRFTFAEAMFREALRMYPTVHSVIRRVKADIEVDEGIIPAGSLLNVPFVHLLRDPQRFPSPESFDPDRWKERPRPGTIETAMFGGGPHFCLGYHIAIVEGTLFTL
ncbi:MAG: cytochrome P450, partial [Myxococcales bacterium]|nr:cytochrome P450 [Myxococcales bacterium]